MMFKKDEWALEDQIEGMIVCDKMCLSVVSTSSLLSHYKSQTSLVDEIPCKGICDQ